MQSPLKRRASAAYTIPHPPDTQGDYPSLPTEPLPRGRPFKRYFLLGAVLVFVCWFGLTQIVLPFITSIEKQWHYGDNPMYSLDADMGHGGTSHFLAFVLRGEILVIEINPKYEVQVYRCGAIVVEGAEKPMIVLDVQDINHDGKPDLLVHLAGQSASVVLLNTGNGFVLQGS